MADVAYAPKAGREDPDHFGAIYVTDDHSLNIRELLEAGNGYIVVSDPADQTALDAVENLKRVTVDEATRAQEPQPDPLDSMTKDDLLGLPEAADIPRAQALKVDELRDAVRRAREGA
jgi:hypothetical protein